MTVLKLNLIGKLFQNYTSNIFNHKGKYSFSSYDNYLGKNVTLFSKDILSKNYIKIISIPQNSIFFIYGPTF